MSEYGTLYLTSLFIDNFRYPYNNFLHHRVEEIIVCCLESKNASLVKHILEDCNLVRSIIDAERNSALSTDENNAKVNISMI